MVLLVSDMHFGRPQGTPPAELAAAIARQGERVIVIAGDIVQTAKDCEYERAYLFLKELVDTAPEIEIVLTIGNHDLGGLISEGANALRVSDKSDVARAHLGQLFELIVKRPSVLAHNELTHDTITRIGDDVFVALCSHHGLFSKVTEEQLLWTAGTLTALGLRGPSALNPNVRGASNPSNTPTASEIPLSNIDDGHFPCSPPSCESTSEVNQIDNEPITDDCDPGHCSSAEGDDGNTSVSPTAMATPTSFSCDEGSVEPKASKYVRLHLVTHHCIWSDPKDYHRHMDGRNRLEKVLLGPFRFFSVINGHNHRFEFQREILPFTKQPIYRISIPTISSRTRDSHCGFVIWDPSSDNPATVQQFGNPPKPSKLLNFSFHISSPHQPAASNKLIENAEATTSPSTPPAELTLPKNDTTVFTTTCTAVPPGTTKECTLLENIPPQPPSIPCVPLPSPDQSLAINTPEQPIPETASSNFTASITVIPANFTPQLGTNTPSVTTEETPKCSICLAPLEISDLQFCEKCYKEIKRGQAQQPQGVFMLTGGYPQPTQVPLTSSLPQSPMNYSPSFQQSATQFPPNMLSSAPVYNPSAHYIPRCPPYYQYVPMMPSPSPSSFPSQQPRQSLYYYTPPTSYFVSPWGKHPLWNTHSH
ncbi:hypothetical protein Pelo_5726 [Pelomyxa schiedti]|nr:hypothetical protein Pelo_5726 [Pelomyxa schiedti]